MTNTIIYHLRIGMIGLLLSVAFMAVMSWFAFPWWAALIISTTDAVALWLFIRIAVTLESMIRESDNLLIEMKRICDDLHDQMLRTGFLN